MGQEGTSRSPRSWAEQVYDECAAQLVLYGRALGLGHAEAEDVVHDTFRVLLELRECPREPKFFALRSFRNRALNHRRGLWRRLARELESRRWFEAGDPTSPAEESAMVELTRLPPEQREVIVLRLWHNLTFEEIAHLLGLSPNTAAGRYRYGIARLRRNLQEESHEPHPEPSPRAHRSDPAWLASAPPLPEPETPAV
ncbi:MAG: sigma-70 family RNA polymerase sigma factor [Verrucomicrobiales bacterium]|nr:sigma-70 family RNA polymerase sigma factor [Verrucomicrobiales bacterium]